MTDMKTAVRGWLGLMALGAVLMAPQALAQKCEDKCSLGAAPVLKACVKKCPAKDKACSDTCTRKFQAQKAKCTKGCKGKKGNATQEPHTHDHDE
ncbi:hypothetical protein D7V97_13635 [Corallococcus sp. CA053C]|uniref:hypothetical protein n=1 Tax=Corallococcus sp. CA053C TaxID=2316732 RepID=UPI000EA38EE4|nr:hypothetical protein [Corallococcus sp. CA053C]RKH10524.1 hypothetical protein D7V97_13635 [Corallococcus sp. CA053C]